MFCQKDLIADRPKVVLLNENQSNIIANIVRLKRAITLSQQFYTGHLKIGIEVNLLTCTPGCEALNKKPKFMTTYISLLRGINVSGHNLIKMNDLRTAYGNLDFKNIRTYLQSGNVIFDSADIEITLLAQKISGQLIKDFGVDIPVLVLTVDNLKQVISANPFITQSNLNPAFFHISFLSSKPENDKQKALEEKISPGEEIVITDEAVYLYCPNGYGKTKLHNKFLETKLQVVATTRNWKTANELLMQAEQTGTE